MRWIRFRNALAVLACGLLSAHSTGAPAADAAAPRLVVETGQHAGPVRRIAVDRADSIAVTVSDDKTARVWSVASGALLRILRSPVGEGAAGQLQAAAIHPREAVVAVGGVADQSSRIWLFSLESGELVGTTAAVSGNVRQLVWTPDGGQLVASYLGDNAIRVFSRAGALLAEAKWNEPVPDIVLGPANRLVSVSWSGMLDVMRLENGHLQSQRQFALGKRRAASVALSPDGGHAVVGFLDPGVAPEVIDLATGALVRRLHPVSFARTHALTTVAWSTDGVIAVGGRSARGPRDFYIARFEGASGRLLEERVVTRDSVTHLLALASGAFAWTGFDGTWGVAHANRSQDRTSASSLADLRGPHLLRVSPDGRRVGWTFDRGEHPAWFDVREAILRKGHGEGLDRPRTRAGLFSLGPSNWENQHSPVVNGRTPLLAPNELSRAVAYVPGTGDAILGTSFAIHRIAQSGEPVWRVPVRSEARAVNVSADGLLVVSAMGDGTIRWRSGLTGRELLALFPQRDGRWIAWTPTGEFDASVGADGLAGWLVSRGHTASPDFHPLALFRDRRQRPGALEDALAAPGASAAAPPSAMDPTDPLPASTGPGVGDRPAWVPPVLASASGTHLVSRDDSLELMFTVRADAPVEAMHYEVRVDGRPVDAHVAARPMALDGAAPGLVRIQGVGAGTAVHLLAWDGRSWSEPLAFRFPDAVAQVARPDVLPRLHLLAVGVGRYRDARVNLEFPAKDARDFAATITRQQGLLYREVQVRVITNEDATRSSVEDGLAWIAQSVEAKDVGMVFLAGHGLHDQGGTWHFLPHDWDERALTSSGVSERSIRDALRSVRGKAVFFIDTCHAGNALGNTAVGRQAFSRLVNSLASPENGVIVFAASTGEQLAEEDPQWGNGAFTRALIDGIDGRADLTGRGRVTFKGLDYFVSEEVTRLTAGRQTPVTLIPMAVPDFAIAIAGAGRGEIRNR